MTEPSQAGIPMVFSKIFRIPPEAIDANGHVNNVQYVQWMQDIAVSHYEALGGVGPAQAVGGSWVVRTHSIEYFRPAFAGEEVEVRTWVANLRRVRSLRRYEFIRKLDGAMLVKGETEWVFVEQKTGLPLAIPQEIARLLPVRPDGE
jgi:acyl-CoA thioester hydrolase